MKGLLQHKTRTLVLAAALLAAAGFSLLHSHHPALTCQNTAECQQQFNWLSWLQGQSRSAQFHFVDLLELLDRMLPASHDSK
ncbi:hypothetical protein [Alkalimonas mucilaginosa]|uniref:Uncharacterized protein n=1 Tax=Alkalimonas mucilaginosa TaxID=3057676 RepID=A0ABU7JCJ8_9GAMM|nr:hypothetical protein [Alkalimonas sp. MEB004]MEE2023413.1 hypothetical protein [Alkalimonas sp. MEB004]